MDAVRRARFIPPVRPDGMSDEDFFGLFFNQYDRVPEMTAETQVNLLFRSCGLVALSNRRPGADLDLLTNQRMPFIRNRSGVAWHPIFISTDQFDVEDEEEEGGTKSWEDLECDAASAARKKVSLDSPRKNLLVPLHHIADLMVHNHILSLDKEHQVKRNPTYPANFRHGDILCLAVLPKKDGETLIDWYRNDGTYIWLETPAHPQGFPHSLGDCFDEYSHLPAQLTFNSFPQADGRLVLPDSHFSLVDHNHICFPDQGTFQKVISNIQWKDLRSFQQLISDHHDDTHMVELTDQMDSILVPIHLNHDVPKKLWPTAPGNRDLSIPYSIVNVGEKIVYMIFFTDFEICLSTFNHADVIQTILERYPLVGYAENAGSQLISWPSESTGELVQKETFYLVFKGCLDEMVLSKKKERRSVELARSMVEEYVSPRVPSRKNSLTEANSKDQISEAALSEAKKDVEDDELIKQSSRKLSLENTSGF